MKMLSIHLYCWM